MKTEHVETLEEMVFRNKNKSYGAYSLRKKYTKYLTLSLVISFFIMLSGLTYPVIANFLTHRTIGLDNDIICIFPDLNPPPSDVAPPPPPPPPPADIASAERFTPPKIVTDSVETDFGTQATLADNKVQPLNVGDINTDPEPTKKEQVIPQVVKPEPLLIVQEMPKFPGGDGALFTFLTKSITYPPDARDMNISGTIYVSFVVETDGAISEIKVERGIGGGCDEEAVRVIKSMPNWTPGKQNNIPVRVRFSLPVKFTLH
jgi:periplasmic protein TonB